MELLPNFNICSKCSMFAHSPYMGDRDQEKLYCECSQLLMGVRILQSGVETRTVNFSVPSKCPYHLEHLIAVG